MEGSVLALLIECKKSAGGDIEESSLFCRLLETINSCNKSKESFSLVFINSFFKNCIETGSFSDIIRFFIDTIVSDSTIYNGRDLLGLFLGLDHLLYWIASQPQIFIRTLQDLDRDTKKIILFQLKMEIEEYHCKNYLTKDWAAICISEYGHDNYHDIKQIKLKNGQMITHIDTPGDYSYMTIIPGSKWEMMRFNNISDYSKVCIPGFCINCRSEQSLTVNIFEYLYSVVSMLTRGSDGIITSYCDKCNEEDQVISLVVTFPWNAFIHLHPEYKNDKF